MPKDADRRDLTRDEIEKKKFETFFTTSVAQVPEEMINPTRQPDRKHGLLARFFGKLEKARGAPPPEDQEEEEIFWAQTPIAPTGEIMLDRPGQEKADGSLELAARPSLEDLTRELETGQEQISYYIPPFLGRLICQMPDKELLEGLDYLDDLIHQGSLRAASAALSIGVMVTMGEVIRSFTSIAKRRPFRVDT